MKKNISVLKTILLCLLAVLSLTIIACNQANVENDKPQTVATSYPVKFETNGGSIINDVTVLENDNLVKPSNPTKAGYTFVGWYFDNELTQEVTFPTTVTKSITLYAKWQKVNSGETTYGIVDFDYQIPTNLKFSNEAHQSANHSVIDCATLTDGSYNVNYNKANEGKTISGITMLCYRYGLQSSGVNLYAPKLNYDETAYHGREGCVYNSNALGGINQIVVTYNTTSTEGNIYSNVRFGTTAECNDYVYFLEPSSAYKTETINVNLSGYQYFSVNTGSYDMKVSTISVDYDNNTLNTDIEAKSGENKVRINPVKYTYSLVPGESKITVPLGYKFDESTNSYVATSTKEFTYYTLDYVRDHSECYNDAVITDPLLVCAYYNAFSRWPANYSKNVNQLTTVFGSDSRKVSEYSRTDGYVKAVPWNFNGVYYELDVDIDGTYSTGSRGVGRIVVWQEGWTEDGYDNSPCMIYTDDHYNTFMEYLNNGTWSNRFNAEGAIAGIKYSAPTTVTLKDYDAKMVEAKGTGVVDPDDPNKEPVNNADYYANFAPVTIINNRTAMYQKVTSVEGVVEGSKYVIINEDYPNTTFNSNVGFRVDTKKHAITLVDESSADYISPLYFKKVSESSGYLYMIINDTVYYLYSSGKNINYDSENKTLYNISFDKYGNFSLYTSDSYYLRYNTSNSGIYRFYLNGGQQPVQLYRYCDIEGATPDYYDYEFEMVESVDDLYKNGEYVFVFPAYNTSLGGNGDTFTVDFNKKELKVTKDSDISFVKFERKKFKDIFLYAIYYEYEYWGITSKWYYSVDVNDGNYYLTVSNSPTYFKLEFDSLGKLKLMPYNTSDENNPIAYTDSSNSILYIDYYFSEEYDGACLKSGLTLSNLSLFKLKTDEENLEFDTTAYTRLNSISSIDTTKGYIIVSTYASKALGDTTSATYTLDDDKNLVIKGKAAYKTLYFEKITAKCNFEEKTLYAIYILDGESKLYLKYSNDPKTSLGTLSYGSTPSYFDLEIIYNGSIRINALYYRDALGDYVHMASQGNYPYLEYDQTSGQFKLVPYDNGDTIYIFEVVELI